MLRSMREYVPRTFPARPLAMLLGIALAPAYAARGREMPVNPQASVVVLPREILDSMSAVFTRFNEHWDELQDLNTLSQALGTVRPTQREFLGCLSGEVGQDTLWIRGWAPARNMKQLQFAVAGDCQETINLVGTFHTHPYRADPNNSALKEPALSAQDLETFAAAPDLVVMAVWDVDSVDVALKDGPGTYVHPAPLIVR